MGEAQQGEETGRAGGRAPQGRDIVIFGEVLFDHLPDGKKVLGGAPFNVAWNLQALGDEPLLISGVGADAEGETIRREMEAWGLSQAGTQTIPDASTGRVDVSLTDGQPSYEIPLGQAWDQIRPGSDTAGRGGELLYHGTLALRNRTSRDTLLALREGWAGEVFLDVNLRDPWYDADQVRHWAEGVDWLKLNLDEFRLIGGEDAAEGVPLESALPAVARRHGIRQILCTAGGRGAWLYSDPDPLAFRPGRNDLRIADTVGAGDAFAAMAIHAFRRGSRGEELLDRASAFAEAVCGLPGATTKDRDFYRPFAS